MNPLVTMNPLWKLRLFILIFLLMASQSHAEYVLYKSQAGVLLISNTPSEYFSFDVPGSNVTPADLDSSPHPRMFSDAFYLEIIPIPITPPIPKTETEEAAFLHSHFEAAKSARSGLPSDISSQSVRLKSDLSALMWSFVPFGDRKRFYCVAFRSKEILFLLKAGFADEATQEDPAQFLLKVANSFVRSSTPIPPPKK